MNQTPRVATATIIYESMFGNTRAVAAAIADGLRSATTVTVIPVKDAPESFPDVDLVLVGAPTHVHGLSRPASRTEAGTWVDDPERHLTLEPDAEGIGVREWLDACADAPARYAAFDTRADMTELFSGSAARSIEKRLQKLGAQQFCERKSFLVDKNSVLEPGQLELARDWGRTLATELQAPALR
ncbi:flavodoxin family protein [Leifsonia sp. 2TAF2]|uniref:flavodoxin family protein n=1 Tax=Leifsonia sp. 2TAF2 TaxID=3233009 RepID=UPI003F99EFBE